MSKGPHPPTPFEVGTLLYTPFIEPRPDGGITVRACAAYIVSGSTPYDAIMRDSKNGELFRTRGLHRFAVDSPTDPLDNPACSVTACHSHYIRLDDIIEWLNEHVSEWGVRHDGEGHQLAWDFADDVDAVLFKLRWC
jgi:hypothetical protein